MSDSTIEAALVAYNLTDATIAEMSEKCLALTVDGIDDKDGFKVVHTARMVVRGKRVEVEKTRKELKADALDYGRKVDAEAKRITALLTPIEEHLQGQERVVEEERERIKDEEAERVAAILAARMKSLDAVGNRWPSLRVEGMSAQEFSALLATATQDHAQLQAELKATAEAEAKAAEERRVEDDRLRAESAKLEAERAELEAEKRRIAEAESERIRKAELEVARQEAAAKAKSETEERIEREKVAAEVTAKADAEEKARLEALRPDVEKVLAYLGAVRGVPVPKCEWSKAITTALARFAKTVEGLAI